jgi:hypothetical protein
MNFPTRFYEVRSFTLKREMSCLDQAEAHRQAATLIDEGAPSVEIIGWVQRHNLPNCLPKLVANCTSLDMMGPDKTLRMVPIH